ncbi:MAG: prepilin-type N-terminal cleavage/methylation domain-containing protein [Betaproteobacteria bacterium]
MNQYLRNRGFTMIEMAIVLLILGLLLGGGLTVLSTQVEMQKTKDTQRALEEAKEALIGFAVANGRLPCPASAASNGVESPAGGGVCTNPNDGFLPGVTLGLPNIDANGYVTDGWQTVANRIRYAVSTANGNAATTLDGIRNTTIQTFGAIGNTGHLYVCASAAGITATTCGTPANTLTTNAVAVLFSLGKNAPTGGTGVDEAANLNADRIFVSHTPVQVGGAGGEFDDMVTWLPMNILFNRMLQANRLP